MGLEEAGLADLKHQRAGFKLEVADLRPERTDSRLKRADLGSERSDFRLERANLKPERADWKPKVIFAYLSPERADSSNMMDQLPMDGMRKTLSVSLHG